MSKLLVELAALLLKPVIALIHKRAAKRHGLEPFIKGENL